MKGKPAIIAGLIIILLAAIAAKLFLFRSVNDAWFAMNYRSLREVPPGLIVLRPTRYPFLEHSDPICIPTSDSATNYRIMGRNSPLRDLIAVAYNGQPSRVVLPSDAPKGNFDFVVTLNHDSKQQLQTAIRKQLGCRAYVELAETEVLALKVLNPALPGLKLSAPDARPGVANDNKKYYLTNVPVKVVNEWLRGLFDITAVDKTGLTNLYDFSLPNAVKASRPMSEEARRANANELMKDLGLGLEPDTTIDEVLAVKTGLPPTPVMSDKKQTLLGPLNPGAEEGSEHWYHGMNGNGELLIDSTDAASGDSDFTLDNRSTDRNDRADWRCEPFSLGPATNGARPLRFSFDYKLPGPVNDGDNLHVQLRFYDQSTNFLNQQDFFVGTSSHDSAVTGYKTITSDNIQPPAGARLCDVTLSANLYDNDKWSSGIARFDNILVTTGPRSPVMP